MNVTRLEATTCAYKIRTPVDDNMAVLWKMQLLLT
jgi:hypothetical protein